ncbi:MAG: hypothetical protein SFV52_15525 [Saprospiraceae bacterium]|nr:hypothetical protein [Saprospiraceae bacterium]
MIGDPIHIKAEYFGTADAVLAHLPGLGQGRKVLLVGGESGSGKSVTATCLQQRLTQQGIMALVLHQDDYFHLPPLPNHEKRQHDLGWVGPQEVKLTALQAHIDAFLENQPFITKPLVNYRTNEVLEETVPLDPYQVLIIEGTYVLLLERAFAAIFMDRDYQQTLAQRIARNREPYDPFVEMVLKIEHEIIRKLRPRAHLIVNTDYSVSSQQAIAHT